MASKPKALIVGAGIAGLSAAWWLDKAGWTSILIERAPAIRGGGYIVALSGPCIGTIREMGLGAQLDALSYKFDANVIRDNRGRELFRVAYKDVYGELDSYAICRGDLARLLADALPHTAAIRFDETLDHVVDDGGDKIRAKLKGGEIIEADLLIGADGIRSSVRSQFWPGEDCLEDLGYAYAVYDVERQNTVSDADCVSFNSPGHLDVLYSLRDNRLAALHVWREDWHAKPPDRRRRFDTLRQVTAGGVSQVSEVIDLAERAGSSPVIDSLTMVNLPHWSRGRVLLLGDAAHCLTLMSGQGAGMALLSAEILGKELAASSADLFQALANHERRLRPIIERLQQRSRSMTSAYIPKSTLMYHLRNLVLKVAPYSWIVSWHVGSAKTEIDLTRGSG